MAEEPRLTEEQEQEIAWTRDDINDVPSYKWIYKVACFLIGKKKMTYQEMFLLFYGLNKKNIGEEQAKKYAIERIIALYEYNNGKTPEGIEKIYGTQSLDSGRE